MAEQYQISGSSATGIVDDVEVAVRAGRLAPGERLPSVRALAARLGVANATVAAAYRALRQRGVVETAGRHGTRVRSRPAVAVPVASELPSGLRDLSRGEPDPALLPDLSAAMRRIDVVSTGYATAQQHPALLDAARERLAADGVRGSVTITSGALDAVERALSVHNGPGDAVAIVDPCWANLRDLVAALGMRAVPVPEDHSGPTVEGVEAALRAGARAIVLISRAHNPTGTAIDVERARRLRAVLADHPELLVIEDDHWAELAREPLHPVADAANRWLFVRSVSKPFGPDLRVAVACGDPDTVARVRGRMSIGSGWVSTILQRIVLELWRDPAVPDALRSAAGGYRRRRTALLEALDAKGIHAWGRTGLNVWVPVNDETTAVTACRDAGYAVSPGRAFRLSADPGVRVTVAGMAESDAEPLAAALAAATR